MSKVQLDRFGYCGTTGKRKLTDLVADEVIRKARLQGNSLYKYLCPDCVAVHLTHCDQDRYEYYGPRTDPVVARTTTTFPMPAANVKALVEFKKRNRM